MKADEEIIKTIATYKQENKPKSANRYSRRLCERKGLEPKLFQIKTGPIFSATEEKLFFLSKEFLEKQPSQTP